MTQAEDEAFRRGKQAGQVESLKEAVTKLEKLVEKLTSDVKYLMWAVGGMYGAIALVKILPELRDLFSAVN